MKFREHLKEMMEDEDFRKEYETLQPQYEVVKQIISARARPRRVGRVAGCDGRRHH